MASKAGEFRKKQRNTGLAECATKPYAIESRRRMVEYWLEMAAPKRLQRIGNSSPSLVRAAARAKGRTAQMVGDEDPRAPYKVYEGDELRGTYATRAEARRRQQQLESEQATRPEPHHHVRIEDNSGDAAM
jgi:hypothetical protein